MKSMSGCWHCTASQVRNSHDWIQYLWRNDDSVFVSISVQELYSACNPVLSKPKPKVEPPKEEKTENGPVNGQEGTENHPSNPDKAAPAGTEQGTVENKLPEMDID